MITSSDVSETFAPFRLLTDDWTGYKPSKSEHFLKNTSHIQHDLFSTKTKTWRLNIKLWEVNDHVRNTDSLSVLLSMCISGVIMNPTYVLTRPALHRLWLVEFSISLVAHCYQTVWAVVLWGYRETSSASFPVFCCFFLGHSSPEPFLTVCSVAFWW